MIEQIFRDEWGRVLASLVGFLGDFDLAEEATQDAFVTAAERWPREGYPRNPGAWLVTTARNRAVDRIRRDRTLSAKLPLLDIPHSVELEVDETVIPDERLELLFMSCHPALPLDAQVALTLRALGGLTTGEIARAFLVPYDTMKRRLSRAKAKIKSSGVTFSLPPEDLRSERLAGVLAVLYLIFNEGYSGRGDLATEAIRLCRILASLMCDEPEPSGLLALMLLHDARRDARFAGDEIVLLAEQDRSLWDEAEISEGRAVLNRALALGRRGPYLLQAQITSLQLAKEVDWAQVSALYAELASLTGSPVVELNRAVAISHVQGPQAALKIVDQLQLDDYQYLHSTRGELLRRLGRIGEARTSFERALVLAHNDRERRFLEQRLASLR